MRVASATSLGRRFRIRFGPLSSAASTSQPVSAPPPAAARRPAEEARVLTGWRRGLVSIAGAVMRVWCASLHIQPSPETRRLMAGDPQPTLFVLWHNRLFVAAELSRRLRPARPLHGLVSASKDGAWLTAFFESAGLRVVRGSSSRGGREAAAALVDVLLAGHDAGITPDGPRGPIYGFKPGAVVVARRGRARVVLVGIDYANAWRLRSWDHFLLPHPFSSVRVHAEVAESHALEDKEARAHLEATLLKINCDPDLAREQPAGERIDVI
jgi:lysophospholipid acyltransferase (LPLAT)-like uncharacterized protein